MSLPTPLAVVNRFVDPSSQAAVEPAYEKRLLAELKEICTSLPATELAIQWDVAVELALLEGVWTSHLGNVKGGVMDRLVRLGNAVPADAELGFHLCYGDFAHKHFAEPKDTGLLVDIANKLAAGVRRPIDWVHMPVPRERTDDEFFRPLSRLSLKPGTELYLGLIHQTDGGGRRACAHQGGPERPGGFRRCHRVRHGSQAARDDTGAAGAPRGARGSDLLSGVSPDCSHHITRRDPSLDNATAVLPTIARALRQPIHTEEVPVSARKLVAALLMLVATGAAAQTPKESYLKALQAYGDSRYLDAERLLLSAEQQLGAPKPLTTSLLILCEYKSNAFDSGTLMDRISRYEDMNPGQTDVTQEIQGIKATVTRWKTELDGKAAALKTSRDAAAARVEAAKTWKMTDYNTLFRGLSAELSALCAEVPGGASYKDWGACLEGLRLLAAGSRYGFAADALARTAALEPALVEKMRRDGFPEEAFTLYGRYLPDGRYAAEVSTGVARRRAAEAKAAEEKRLAEQRRRKARHDELIESAVRLEADASVERAYGVLMLAGGIGAGALSGWALYSVLTSEGSDTNIGIDLVAGGGIGLAAWLLGTFNGHLSRADRLDSEARADRSQASRYALVVSPRGPAGNGKGRVVGAGRPDLPRLIPLIAQMEEQ